MKRIENLKVDAIMTRNPVTVSADSSAREVAKLLAKYHIIVSPKVSKFPL